MLFVVNLALFQVGWFSSVIGGARQLPWIGPLTVLAVLAIHLYIARRPQRELMLVVSCAALGATFDSLLLAAGWVRYSSGMFNEMLAPYWIITMWMLFATTLNVSLRWLQGRDLLAAAFGLAGGPLTYLAGQRLGGIALINETAALVALGVGWAVLMPVLLRLAQTFDGIAGGYSGAEPQEAR